MSLALVENIDVNLDDPDDHFQFKIYPCVEIEGNDGKTRYDGFFIVLEQDIRFYFQDAKVEWYTCRIFSKNQLLVQTPAADWDFVNSRDFIEVEHAITGDPHLNTQLDDSALEAIDTYNNRIGEDETLQAERKFKHYILTFPPDVDLSVKEIFAQATEDAYLDGVPINVRTFHEEREGIMNTRTFVCWHVVDKSRGKRKIGPGDHKPTSKMATKLGIRNAAAKPNSAIATYQSQLNAQVQQEVHGRMQQAQGQMQQQVQQQARDLARQLYQEHLAQQQQQQPQPDGVGSNQQG